MMQTEMSISGLPHFSITAISGSERNWKMTARPCAKPNR